MATHVTKGDFEKYKESEAQKHVAVTGTVDSIKKEVSAVQDGVSAVQVEVENLKRLHAEAQGLLGDLRKELDTAEIQRTEDQDKVGSMRTEIDEAKRQMASRGTIADRMDRFESKWAERDSGLTESHQDVLRQLEEASAKLKDVNAHVSDQEKVNDSVKEAVDRLEKHFREAPKLERETDEEKELKKDVADRKGFGEKMSKYSGDRGEQEFKNFSFDLKRTVTKRQELRGRPDLVGGAHL